MFKNKKYFKTRLAFLLILPFVLSSCGVVNVESGNSNPPSGGIYRSSDLGKTWEHATKFYNVYAQDINFNTANIMRTAFDLKHDGTVYLGTQHDGIIYTYNYGKGWFKTLTGKGTVNDIAVDPLENCTIYAAVHDSIYKTSDCARTWERTYFETRNNGYITSVGVNGDDNRIIYAANSLGDFLKSQDFGRSWDVVRRFEGKNLKRIFVQNQYNSQYIYLVSLNSGIYKSIDGGVSWENLMDLPVDMAEVQEDEFDKFSSFKGSKEAYAFNIDNSVDDGIIFTNKIGMFRLTDGKLWRQIKLLTPPNKEAIYSVVVNPKKTEEIFYGTPKAIYHTVDNGENWEVNKLPSPHRPKILDFSLDGTYLYLGFLALPNN